MKIQKVLVGVLLAVSAALLWFWLSAKPVEGVTDRDNYMPGDPLTINVKNGTGKAVCFSSCYPYLVERRDGAGDWAQFEYDDCPYPEVASDCVPAGGIKKFRLPLDEAEVGLNRLKLNICFDCAAGDPFLAESVIYSNVFEVK